MITRMIKYTKYDLTIIKKGEDHTSHIFIRVFGDEKIECATKFTELTYDCKVLEAVKIEERQELIGLTMRIFYEFGKRMKNRRTIEKNGTVK